MMNKFGFYMRSLLLLSVFCSCPLFASAEEHRVFVEHLRTSDDEGQFLKLLSQQSWNEQQSKTALFIAIEKGYLQAVKELIEHKNIQPNTTIENGLTPLHFATAHGHLLIDKYLLHVGVPVDSLNDNHDTPLLLASLNGCLEVMEILLSAGARIEITNKQGNSALHLAAANVHLEIIKFLLDNNVPVDALNDNHDTPLLLVSFNGHVDAMRILLAAGARLEITNTQGNSVLHAATINGHRETIQFLLENNVPIDVLNDNGDTPLLLASLNGHVDAMKILLAAGARLEITNKQDNSALHLAAAIGHREAIQFSLEHNVPIDVLNKNGETPLLLAVFHGHLEAMKSLLSAGANENINPEQSLLHIASSNDHMSSVRFFLNKGTSINLRTPNWGATPLHLASISGSLKVVKFLLSKSAIDLNALTSIGMNALHCAASANQHLVIEYLVQSGVDINAQTTSSTTALDKALGRNALESAALLIILGAGYTSAHIEKLAEHCDFGRVLWSLMPHILQSDPGIQDTWRSILAKKARENSSEYATWSNTEEGRACNVLYRLLSPYMCHEPIPYLEKVREALSEKFPEDLVRLLFEHIGLPFREVNAVNA